LQFDRVIVFSPAIKTHEASSGLHFTKPIGRNAQEVLMSKRFISASVILSATLAVVPLLQAAPSVDSITDAAAGTEIENSKFQFEGEVNGNAVYVRSGPSDSDYATTKLDKGAKVTVVGIKFDWLKVLPPEGSFCYVAKAYVEKRGDGTVGRVTNTLNVRVGSALLPMKTKVATKLEPNQDVTILGEQDEYFKIKPPSGVFFYVNKQFVDPVRRVDVPGISTSEGEVAGATGADAPAAGGATVATAEPTPEQTIAAADVAPSQPPVEAQPAQTGISSVAQNPPESTGPASQPPSDTPANSGAALTDAAPATDAPAGQPAAAEYAAAPTTQPNEILVSADIRFDQLEARLKEAARLPIEQQPVPELLAGYQQLASDSSLTNSLRTIAESRAATLKIHNENYELALSHQRALKDREAAAQAKKAESEELMERLKTTGLVFYSALGTIRPSTLQGADQTLYRLTDPISGRTVIYLKSNDPSLARMNGLFVGIQGEIQDDAQMKLRFISPTEITPVDQRAVHRTATARIVPPSLMPGGALAGSSTEEVGR